MSLGQDRAKHLNHHAIWCLNHTNVALAAATATVVVVVVLIVVIVVVVVVVVACVIQSLGKSWKITSIVLGSVVGWVVVYVISHKAN